MTVELGDVRPREDKLAALAWLSREMDLKDPDDRIRITIEYGMPGVPVPGGPPVREGNNPRTGIAWNE